MTDQTLEVLLKATNDTAPAFAKVQEASEAFKYTQQQIMELAAATAKEREKLIATWEKEAAALAETTKALQDHISKVGDAKGAWEGFLETMQKGVTFGGGFAIGEQLARSLLEIPKAAEQAFASIIEGSMVAAEQMHKLSISTAESVEQLGIQKLAATEASLSLERISQATALLEKKIETGSKSFAKLGLDAEQLMAIPAGEAFDKVIGRLSELDNHFAQVAVAQDLFGRMGTRTLLPFIEQMQGAEDRANKLATTLGKGEVDALIALEHATKDVGAAWEGLQEHLAAALISTPGLVDDVKLLAQGIGSLSAIIQQTAPVWHLWVQDFLDMGRAAALLATAGISETLPDLVKLQQEYAFSHYQTKGTGVFIDAPGQTPGETMESPDDWFARVLDPRIKKQAEYNAKIIEMEEALTTKRNEIIARGLEGNAKEARRVLDEQLKVNLEMEAGDIREGEIHRRLAQERHDAELQIVNVTAALYNEYVSMYAILNQMTEAEVRAFTGGEIPKFKEGVTNVKSEITAAGEALRGVVDIMEGFGVSVDRNIQKVISGFESAAKAVEAYGKAAGNVDAAGNPTGYAQTAGSLAAAIPIAGIFYQIFDAISTGTNDPYKGRRAEAEKILGYDPGIANLNKLVADATALGLQDARWTNFDTAVKMFKASVEKHQEALNRATVITGVTEAVTSAKALLAVQDLTPALEGASLALINAARQAQISQGLGYTPTGILGDPKTAAGKSFASDQSAVAAAAQIVHGMGTAGIDADVLKNAGVFAEAAKQQAYDAAIAGGQLPAEATKTSLATISPLLTAQLNASLQSGVALDQNTKDLIAEAKTNHISIVADPLIQLVAIQRDMLYAVQNPKNPIAAQPGPPPPPEMAPAIVHHPQFQGGGTVYAPQSGGQITVHGTEHILTPSQLAAIIAAAVRAAVGGGAGGGAPIVLNNVIDGQVISRVIMRRERAGGITVQPGSVVQR